MTELQQIIETTANGIIDGWAREAQSQGLDTEMFIGDQLDILEDTEPEVALTVSKRWVARRFAR